MPSDNFNDTLLTVQDLKKFYPVRSGLLRRVTDYVKAIDGVSFSIRTGETFGLVGESGCGKTTMGLTIMQIEEATSGAVVYKGVDLTAIDKRKMTEVRRSIQFIFQDPYSSLDPRMTVGESVGEGLLLQGETNKKVRNSAVEGILKKVGLETYHMNRYPHEFSGGQQQRIGIARALIVRPDFLILDEPVSALDVSVQSQIMNLLKDLQQEYGLTYLFIAHNLGVVEYISDRIGVMYLGKMFELTSSSDLFVNPLHPYTQALLSAIPVPDPKRVRQTPVIPGEVPSPVNPPKGCRFHPRCPFAQELCRIEEPPFEEVEPDHFVACWLAQGKL